MSHKVRQHTRTVNGRTVTVRRHQAEDPAAAQKKRHAFERRVQRERQQAAAQALLERQLGEALYERQPGRKPRTPGERKRRKARLKPARARRHAKKALRLWRRHKVKAVLFAGLALGEITAWGVITGASRARRACGRWRKRKTGRK